MNDVTEKRVKGRSRHPVVVILFFTLRHAFHPIRQCLPTSGQGGAADSSLIVMR